MGCFNRTGFLSHLPIQYGDEIVLFVLIKDEYGYRHDSCPIGIGGELRPLCAPFFGKYDDYGGIKDVVDDANHKLFVERTGMSVEQFLSLEEYFGFTVEQLVSVNGECDENEEMTDQVKLTNLYYTLFGKCKEIDQITFSYTMEHKAVYDKMVELGKQTYFDGWYGKKTSIDDAFDNTASIINKLGNKFGEHFSGLNPLKLGDVLYEPFFLDETDEDKDLFDKVANVHELLSYKVCLYDHFAYADSDYVLYDKITNVEPYRDNLTDYAYFLKSMKDTYTVFEVSPYHGQDVQYETLIPLYEKMLEILKSRKKNLEL